MRGNLHPSLQAYIDCFSSPPFPRVFPRGGGVWDQDPILMRDFRLIREFEGQWKSTQEQQSAIGDAGSPKEGGNNGLEDALDSYLADQDLGSSAVF